METLEQLKTIVKNAPEKATHVDFNGHYWHNSSAFYWLCCDDGSTTSNAEIGNHIRKLSDINLTIELMERVNKLEFMVEQGLGEEDMVRDI